MANAVMELFDSTIQKTINWFDELTDMLEWDDPNMTYVALRAILHTLRDRLPVPEAADLGAQLPMLIRGMYYEGWKPSGKPIKLKTKQEFLAAICDRFPDGCDFDADLAVRTVFAFLRRKVTSGEIQDVIQNMPRDLIDWWRSRAEQAKRAE